MSIGFERRLMRLPLAAMVVLQLGLVGAIVAQDNPPAEGFDAAGSDARAMAIADQVMAAMGGRKNWDSTRYISWNFFGMRTHVWDKWTGDLRLMQGDRVVLMNINTKQGRVFQGGQAVTDASQVATQLDGGYKAWVNDSYWLAMPYKLKDSGVTLKYHGEAALPDGRVCDVLELTFEGVGVTPENKYHVFVSRERNLVEQWSYFAKAGDPEPRFTTPWAAWEKHGGVLLSGDRGERKLSDIRVFDVLPRTVFESPEAVDLASLAGAR